jgi:hypothetical protein
LENDTHELGNSGNGAGRLFSVLSVDAESKVSNANQGQDRRRHNPLISRYCATVLQEVAGIDVKIENR